MGKWKKSQICVLLLEVIKLCDKELLGYFVQCLYQRYVNSWGNQVLQTNMLLKNLHVGCEIRCPSIPYRIQFCLRFFPLWIHKPYASVLR